MQILQLSCSHLAVTCTWQSQDACSKPDTVSHASKAPRVGPAKSHLDHHCFMRKGLNVKPRKCQVPNHSWVTGEAGGRLMENYMEKLPELGLNSGLQALSRGHSLFPHSQHTHYIHTLHTHITYYFYNYCGGFWDRD